MLYIVEKATNKIIERFEAWRPDLNEAVNGYCIAYGYKPLNQEITAMGDMIVWVHDTLND